MAKRLKSEGKTRAPNSSSGSGEFCVNMPADSKRVPGPEETFSPDLYCKTTIKKKLVSGYDL